MAKEIWKDPSGNTCTVDPAKWNAKELKLRTEQGWSKAAAASKPTTAPTTAK